MHVVTKVTFNINSYILSTISAFKFVKLAPCTEGRSCFPFTDVSVVSLNCLVILPNSLQLNFANGTYTFKTHPEEVVC